MRAGVLGIGLLAAAFWLATSLQGCSGSGTHRGNVAKIGISLPVSGADAASGIPTQNGAELAIEQANAAGLPGGVTLTAVALDDAVQGVHDPAQGAQNVKSFISDPDVVAVIAPYNSNVAKAEIPLTNDAGIVQISPAATNPSLTKGPEAAKLRAAHPELIAFFRVCSTDDHQGSAIAELAHKLGHRRAFIVDDDETYGTGLADVFERRFLALGAAVLGHEHLTRGQQDFKALLTKIQSLGPDMVFFGGTTASGGGLLRKQMGDAGLGATPFFGGDGIADAEFVHTAGAAANNTYYTVAAPDPSRIPRAKVFAAAYEERWKSPVGPYSAAAYTAASIAIASIAKAIERAGGKLPNRTAVLAGVAHTKNFDSPVGRIGFDANGDTTDPVLSLYEIRAGKAVFVNQTSLRS